MSQILIQIMAMSDLGETLMIQGLDARMMLLKMWLLLSVVATTRRNSTRSMLTSAKLSVGYLVVGITRELDKEPSLHCSSIYINTRWSVLQQCVYLMSYYSFTMLLPQGHHAISMCPDVILFNLHHHVCTMCTP